MKYCLPVVIWILFTAVPFYGEDMRSASKKARLDYEKSIAESKASKKHILTDQKSLEKEIAFLESEVKTLNNDINSMQKQFKRLREEEIKLSRQKSEDEMQMGELAGTVRIIARDIDNTLRHSQFTSSYPERLEKLKPILKKGRFPGMDDLKTITYLFFDEIEKDGEVVLKKGNFIDRTGMEKEADILTIGKFMAFYRSNKEIGFLRYSEGSHKLYALSVLPSWIVRRGIKKYINGKTDDIYIDFSGGAALKQIIHKSTLTDQIRKGGPIVWPILGIGLAAFIMIIERMVSLRRFHTRTDIVMGKVNDLASRGKWDECLKFLNSDKKRGPVHNVLVAGLKNKGEDREIFESILQESILKELPGIERFLPTINILGVIAPLLGLLGTVTGMISTFHVITLYGTGDPRMMSGGISEALVTTEFGLAIAIPIIFMHTFLSRRVEHIIGDMEEKAVALTNIIQKERMG
ncbi:MAG: MotA/TolQ/ExbB proton channel family protein [Thermodesulfobacteriota bacterium]|nr:MotA/TolQ/ExbB proton channel family protein [Thermodesulfobacteriota bacterium]